MNRNSFLQSWMVFAILGLALIIAVAGIIYGWQSNRDAQLASQGQSTAQAAEQALNRQVAIAESTAQAALRQKTNAERSAQEAINAQATAESVTQQRALVEALTDQEVQAAQEKAKLATSRWLAAQSMNTLEQDPQLSAHLALQAIEAEQTFEAENALHQVLPKLRLLNSKPISDIVPNARNNFSHTLVKNGELLILITGDGIVVVDLASGTHNVLTNTKNCYHVESTPDGRWLLTGCSGGYQVRSVETQEIMFTLPDEGQIIYETGLIPPSSSHSLLVFCIPDDKSIHVWDVMSGEEIVFPSPLGEAWHGVVASSDGSRLARIDGKGLVELWNIDSTQKIFEFEITSNVYPSAFSPDETRLVLIGTTIQIWDISSPTQEPVLLQEFVHDSWVSRLAFNSDGSKLAVGLGNGQVQVWETETGVLLMTLSGGSGYLVSMTFSRDGNRLYTVLEDGRLNEWDISGVMLGWIGRVPYSLDGSQMALANNSGYVSIINSQTGEVQLSWQAHTGWIANGMDILWSPGGKHLATFSRYDNAARIWDVTTGQLLQEIPGDEISAIAWSPDGNHLAIQNLYDLTVWNIPSQAASVSISGLYADELTYTPDGTKIITGDAQCNEINQSMKCTPELVVYDATTGAELFKFGTDSSGQSHSSGGRRYSLAMPDSSTFHVGNPIKGVTLSPQASFIDGSHFAMAISQDGQHLAVGTFESVILWHITNSGAEKDRVLTHGIIESLTGLAINPDGSLLAAAYRGKVRIWDVETGQVHWEVDGWGPIVFSPNGTRLAVLYSGRMNIHVVLQDELIDEIRSHIIRPLTPEECQAYLYEDSCPAWP